MPEAISPLAVPLPRPTAPPAVAIRRELRIEAPPEEAPISPAPLPATVMPVLAVKPAVRVGLLESTAGVVASPRHIAMTNSGFDANADVTSGTARRQISGGFDGPASKTSPGKVKPPIANVGFDQVEAFVARTAAPKVVTTPFEGIEILEKPRPIYTEEARRLRIEGTVQLRVVFGAAGQIRVVGVVKGLGHGLDEAAVQAAEAIRFRPARRDGQPVDAPALIQILFQIA